MTDITLNRDQHGATIRRVTLYQWADGRWSACGPGGWASLDASFPTAQEALADALGEGRQAGNERREDRRG